MWLTAVPVHALWESAGYSPYMLQSDTSTSIDSNYLSTTSTNLDGSGTNKLYALNHTRLTTGAIYGAINTGDVVAGGSGAYDTHHYRFASSGSKLKYSLQDGTVNSDGSVTGGSSARLSEQLVINKVTNFTPAYNNRESAKVPGTGTCSTSSTSLWLSATNSKALLPGDTLYTGSILYQGTFIGIVESVDYTSGEITLTENAKTTISASGSINAISPNGFWSDQAGSATFDSQTLVFTGEAEAGTVTLQDAGASSTSTNIIGNDKPGYNRYNFRFGVGQRVYNQSTLLNTYTNLKSVNSYESAPNVIDVKFGDLATYTSPMLNVEVTRFNAKTHIESSTSVTGANLHI